MGIIFIFFSHNLQDYGAKVLTDASTELGPIVVDGMKEFSDVMMTKHRAIKNSLEEELSPISSDYEEEMKSVQQDLRQMRRELKRMQKNNDLYLQTLEQVYSGSVEAAL